MSLKRAIPITLFVMLWLACSHDEGVIYVPPPERQRPVVASLAKPQKWLLVRFSGLTDLVLDGKGAKVLLPNATTPGDFTLKAHGSVFNAEHQAILVGRQGKDKDGMLSAIKRCAKLKTETVDGRSLAGWEFSIHDPTGSVPFTPEWIQWGSSLAQLAPMREWVEAANSQKQGTFGAIPADLLTGYASVLGTPARITSRVVINQGDLYVSQLFGSKVKGIPALFGTQRVGILNGSGASSVPTNLLPRTLASQLTLRIPIQSTVTLRLTSLADKTTFHDYRFEVETGADAIELEIENSPVPGHCSHSEDHFAAHFFLRDDFSTVSHLIVPAGLKTSVGAYDNGQCSPAFNQ